MKKITSLFALLFVSIVTFAYDAEIGGIHYNFDNYSKTASVTYRDGNYSSYLEEVIEIPSSVTYNGVDYKVTSVGDYAFKNCKNLVEVVVPEGVVAIRYQSFSGCTSLAKITLPGTITSLGCSTFSGCSSLVNVYFEGSLSAWLKIVFDCGTDANPLHNGANLYIEGKRVEQITIPDDITAIKSNAFTGCKSLVSVVVPEQVTSIGNYAFYSCSALEDIAMANSITTIGEYAFHNCDALTKIVLPEGLTFISYNLFSSCDKLVSVTIPNSVKSIGSYAFCYCNAMNSITIPNSVLSIGREAFDATYAMEDVYYTGDVSQWCKITFEDSQANPMGCAENLYINGVLLEDLVLPNTLTSLKKYVFYGCESLKSVTIPNTITAIGTSAFSGCSSLKDVNYLGELLQWTSVDFTNAYSNPLINGAVLAFNGETVYDLVLPNGATTVAKYAFYGCKSLQTIEMPSTLTSVGGAAFKNCSNVISITTKATTPPMLQNEALDGVNPNLVFVQKGTKPLYTEAWGDAYTYVDGDLDLTINVKTPGTLATEIVSMGYLPIDVTKLTITGELNETDFAIMRVNMSRLHTLDISAISNTTIPEGAFEGKSILLNLTLPTNLEVIANKAFYGCSGLTSIIIPTSVNSIGSEAFSGCSGLKALRTNADISLKAFYGCSNIKTLILGTGVKTIASEAFEECRSLEEVVLPNTLTSVGYEAFNYCSKLVKVDFKGEMVDWCNITFNSSSYSSSAVSNPLYYAQNLYIQGLKVDNLEILGEIAVLKPYVFAGCNFKNVVLDNSIRTISSNAFYGCKELETVVIGNGVETIAANAFQECSALNDITLGNNVANMSYNTFNGCTALRTITCFGTVPAVVANENNAYKQFTSVDPEKCLLKVPTPALNDYMIAPVWGAYGRIELHNMKYHTIVAVPNDSTMGNVTGGRSHVAGSTATLYAFATKGYNFKQWSDGNIENPRSFVVIKDETFVAEFEVNPNPLYTITVKSPNKAQGAVDGGGQYNYGDYAIISATPTSDFHFARWNDGNTQNPRTVLVTSNMTFTAVFTGDEFAVSVEPNFEERGTTEGTTILEKYAKTTISATAKFGYYFEKWNDGNTENPRTITVTRDVVYTAIFQPNKYNVTGLVANEKQGSVSGSGEYDYASKATLIAQPAYGYRFARWTDDCLDNPRQVDVYGDCSFTAEFQKAVFIVSLSVNDDKMGSVLGGGLFEYESMTTLGAIANAGYKFLRWSDGNVFNPRALTVTDNLNLVAEFVPTSDNTYYTVEVKADDPNLGTVVGGGQYALNSIVSIAAIPTNSAKFKRWSDGNKENPRSVVVTGDVTYVAEFQAVGTYYTIEGVSEDKTKGKVNGGGFYRAMTDVTLTAEPYAGYHFTEWSDGVVANPRIVTVYTDAKYVAKFDANMYTIAANANNGSVIGLGQYAYGATATLEAKANEGYHFVKWSDGSTQNPRDFVILADTIVVPEFVINDYLVTVDATNGIVEGAGIYNHNATAMLTAIPNYGYKFNSWSDGVTTNPREIVVVSDTNFVANFSVEDYVITATSGNKSFGIVEGSGAYAYNAVATLIAIPVHGYKFTSWNDGDRSNPRKFVVTESVDFVATFVKDTFNLQLQSSDETMGIVFGEGRYEYQTSVRIAAMANQGYKFVSWSDGSTINPRQYVVNDNVTLTATFASDVNARFTLTVTPDDPTHGFAIGSGEYKVNSQATLAAIAMDGYQFAKWSDGNTDNPRFVIVTEDAEYQAIFTTEQGVKMYYKISAIPNNEEYGVVYGSDVYEENILVELYAEPKGGCYFSNWSNGSTDNPLSFYATEELELIAEFKSYSDVPTDVESNSIEVVVYTTQDALYVEGAESDYYVYDATGRLVYSGQDRVVSLIRGVYVVVVNGIINKIVL